MKILILGAGGREHALAWRLGMDSSSTEVFVWPGNPGMELMAGAPKEKLRRIQAKFTPESFSRKLNEENFDLVIPGAEKFLYEGVGDICEELGIPCLGPNQRAAKLEESKLFSKTIMTTAGVPTARYRDLTRAYREDIEMAFEVLKTFQKPVIKLSGPALGKGVFVCDSPEEGIDVLRKLKAQEMTGIEGGIFVEEGLTGEEVSLFYACHGESFLFLGAAQDHKRLRDGNEGPNTGGMGAVSPVPWAGEDFIQNATENFLLPTLREMKRSGSPFTGILFLGLMVDGSTSNLLEYNVRFGDPETQVVLPLLEGDLTEAFVDLLRGKTPATLSRKDAAAVHVVKAARGYPGIFGEVVEKGQPIELGSQASPATEVFFAGVRGEGTNLFTDGGRVLGVTSWGTDLPSARKLAYEGLSSFRFSGEHFRRDIGGHR